ncbi:DUF5658 family protein [Paenibacillus glycinis]|uniref:DUF5658 domain-containing protein n=1 Tax=Paenibacillus glycinis TaxID=2697035 RepID=A0ABW9XR79_9BACL|nr:DUF5658 family protein [Paenibacillus glycinis]NBD25148.1 hypothetical protein [Paenibacillus glycinis]
MEYLLLGLSAFDALATDIGIRMQAIQEANPVAGSLYETSGFLFYGFKILLPVVLLALLRRQRSGVLVRKGVAFATALYGLIAIYHVCWIAYVLSAG